MPYGGWMGLEIRVVLVLGVVGCGAVSGNDKQDAAGGDVAQGRCASTAAFGALTALPGINTAADEFGARATPDELTVFFPRRPAGETSDIYVASRATTGGVFSLPLALAGVNAAGLDNFAPTVTGDALTLYQMAPGGSSGYDIYVSTRASLAADFSPPADVTVLSVDAASERDPYVLPSGNALYYSREGAGDERIYRSTLSSGGFSAPQEVIAVNKDGQRTFAPVVTPDELTMYFASLRPDPAAMGGWDVWVSRRASTAGPFGPPVIVPELSSPMDDWPTWVSADGCVIYVASARAGGFDAYEARRGD